MTFAVVNTTPENAASQARSLYNMTDNYMLSGISDTEKSQIRNWNFTPSFGPGVSLLLLQ